MIINLEIEGATTEQLTKYKEILSVLLEKGALDGVRGGSTIIHFDGKARFRGIQLDYWPYRKILPTE